MTQPATAPLIVTKLHVPPVPATTLARPRLLQPLQAVPTSRLTLIHAAAGYGKTIVACQWYAALQAQGYAVGWVTLDAGDNDETRFWRYVVAALAALHPSLAPLEVAPPSPSTPAHDVFVPLLINALAPVPQPLVLMLDEYQQITNPAIHMALERCIDLLPAHHHIVLVSRTEPPLVRGRWRTRGEIIELTTADLRCTDAEASAMIAQIIATPLADADWQRLQARTEGWMAGLGLAALALQRSANVEHVLATFGGDHQYVVEYLVTEIMQQLPPTVRQFLLHTAVLDRLQPALCDALLDATDSATTLHWLEQHNIFLVPLADDWYRYHQLVAEALRHRLHREQPDLVATLYRRASAWHAAQQHTHEAIQYALAGDDMARVADLLTDAGGPMLARGEWYTLLGWIHQLPAAVIQAHPALALLAAWVLVITGQFALAEPHIVSVERVMPTAAEPLPLLLHGWRGQIAAMHAQIAAARGDYDQAIIQSAQALGLLPRDNVMRGVLATNLGSIYASLGRIGAAKALLIEGERLSSGAANAATELNAALLLAQANREQGDLHGAAQRYTAVLERTRDYLPHLAIGARLGLADVCYEWNQLERSQQHAQAAFELSQQYGQPDAAVLSLLALAQTEYATGRHDQALRWINQAEHMLASARLPIVAQLVGLSRTRLALASGNWTGACAWADQVHTPTTGDIAPPQASVLLVVAYIRVLQGDHATATTLLDHLETTAQATQRDGLTLGVQTVRALLHASQQCDADAQALLAAVLHRAEPQGYCRSLVDWAAPMNHLLRQLVQQQPDAYIERLCAAFALPLIEYTAPPASSALIEPLTERELDVLRLLAIGASNRAIAERLVITVGTVKTHVNNLLGKLEASNRTEAVARARKHGMV